MPCIKEALVSVCGYGYVFIIANRSHSYRIIICGASCKFYFKSIHWEVSTRHICFSLNGHPKAAHLSDTDFFKEIEVGNHFRSPSNDQKNFMVFFKQVRRPSESGTACTVHLKLGFCSSGLKLFSMSGLWGIGSHSCHGHTEKFLIFLGFTFCVKSGYKSLTRWTNFVQDPVYDSIPPDWLISAAVITWQHAVHGWGRNSRVSSWALALSLLSPCSCSLIFQMPWGVLFQ